MPNKTPQSVPSSISSSSQDKDFKSLAGNPLQDPEHHFSVLKMALEATLRSKSIAGLEPIPPSEKR